MDEKILTLHPQGKRGFAISKPKYDTMKNSVIETFTDFNELTFTELTNETHQKLAGKFDGSINWYVVTVKLDLEARGILERVTQTTPHQILLAI